jgi:hypothetical protein
MDEGLRMRQGASLQQVDKGDGAMWQFANSGLLISD